MPDIPPDLVTAILSRLPVKSLLRFRCVSKSWKLQIDSQDFINSHLDRSMENHRNFSLIIAAMKLDPMMPKDGSNLSSVNLDRVDKASPIPHPMSPASVLCSCNGVLLLKGFDMKRGSNLVLYNPSTRKHKVKYKSQFLTPICTVQNPFPQRKMAGKGSPICAVQPLYHRVIPTAPHMSIFGTMYGFGYDSGKNDYKLISVVEFPNDKDKRFKNETHIYSLRSDTWKQMKDFPFSLPQYAKVFGVHLHGALHTLVNNSCMIVVTDLVEETYRYMRLPDFLDKSMTGMSLDVLVGGGVKGTLCLQACYGGMRHDFWVMEEYGNRKSWMKLLSIAPPSVNHFYILDPLLFLKSSDGVLFCVGHTKFVCYDLEGKEYNVPIHGLPKNFLVDVCVQSLVQVDAFSKTEKCEEVKQGPLVNKRKKRDDFLSKGFKLKL